jgi:hypothetical protein
VSAGVEIEEFDRVVVNIKYRELPSGIMEGWNDGSYIDLPV